MGSISDRRLNTGCQGRHYVYYVSETMNASWRGHLHKMDAGKDIARYICKCLGHSRLMKYTEYDGSVIDADSVGIVFPTYVWGSSLAVYSFLRHLNIACGVYVYAVAVGETLSGDTQVTASRRISSLEEFRRIFMRRGFGTKADIYVRCIDRQETYMAHTDIIKNSSIRERVGGIMAKLLYSSMSDITAGMSGKLVSAGAAANGKEPADSIRSDASGELSAITLSNVFLDEGMLSGVRLCRVM